MGENHGWASANIDIGHLAIALKAPLARMAILRADRGGAHRRV